jgi:hypothetical protein
MVIFCLARTVFGLALARFVRPMGLAFLRVSTCAVVADVASEKEEVATSAPSTRQSIVLPWSVPQPARAFEDRL